MDLKYDANILILMIMLDWSVWYYNRYCLTTCMKTSNKASVPSTSSVNGERKVQFLNSLSLFICKVMLCKETFHIKNFVLGWSVIPDLIFLFPINIFEKKVTCAATHEVGGVQVATPLSRDPSRGCRHGQGWPRLETNMSNEHWTNEHGCHDSDPSIQSVR